MENPFGDFFDRASELEGENEVKLHELYPPSFMARHTDFEDIDAFFEASPYDIETQEDYDALEWSDLDAHTAATTSFDTHHEMGERAGEEWLKRQLNL